MNVATLTLLALAACGARNNLPMTPPPTPVPPDPADTPTQVSPPDDPKTPATPTATSHSMCSLTAPVVSDDACSNDGDCAPSVPCHADQCVAKSKATPRKPGQMCTEILKCTSADANTCGCLKGKCALYPKS